MCFSSRHKDELLIFKQFDSDPKARARYCFHTSFADPFIPPNAPQRQSCEVRAVALFSDKMAAPPPIARHLSDEVFEARVKDNQAAAARAQTARGKAKMPAGLQRQNSARLAIKPEPKPVRREEAQGIRRQESQDFALDFDAQLAFDMQLALAIENSKLVDLQ